MTGKYKYIPERREWLGIIIDDNVVLTVGCEATESEVKAWIAKAIEVQPWIEGNPSVPDMYDRLKH